MSKASEIEALAIRCEAEARNWIGTPMFAGLHEVAGKLREHAQGIEAGTGETRSGSIPKGRKPGGKAMRPTSVV